MSNKHFALQVAALCASMLGLFGTFILRIPSAIVLVAISIYLFARSRR